MKENINITEYAGLITGMLPKGLLLFSQELPLDKIPEDIRKDMYPQDVDGTYCMANRDAHTMYIGEIVDAYVIREGEEA